MTTTYKTPMEWLALCDQRKAESERIDADYTYIDYRDTMCSAHPHLAQALRRAAVMLRDVATCPSGSDCECREEARALLRELGVKENDDNTNS